MHFTAHFSNSSLPLTSGRLWTKQGHSVPPPFSKHKLNTHRNITFSWLLTILCLWLSDSKLCPWLVGLSHIQTEPHLKVFLQITYTFHLSLVLKERQVLTQRNTAVLHSRSKQTPLGTAPLDFSSDHLSCVLLLTDCAAFAFHHTPTFSCSGISAVASKLGYSIFLWTWLNFFAKCIYYVPTLSIFEVTAGVPVWTVELCWCYSGFS